MERTKSYQELLSKYEAVRARLEEAEETLRAIRNHEVDALVVEGPDGDQVFTLQGAEQPYRVLVETMSEGALTMTPDGAVLYCNNQFSELVKLPLNKIMGASFYDFLVSQAHRQSFNAMLEACRKTGCRGAFLLRGADGQEVPTLLSGRSLMLNDVEALCIVATDLSEQKRTQEALRESEAHLRQAQKMEAIGTLAGGIAHDFNNVLAAMIGFTELSIDDAPEGSLIKRNMNYVLKAGIRGRDLVKQILTFSRKSDLKRAPLQITPVVAETFNLLRATTPSTITMKLQTEATSDEVLAESTEITQLLMNLGTNAAYAMRESGGLLEIALRDIKFYPDTLLPHPDLASGAYVELSVKDAGCGMDAETLNRIFDPFFTTKERGHGTGLGLAVVHGIVQSLGGAITVSSEPGRGSTFTVFLPKVAHEEKAQPEMTGAIPGGTERILFVDDEELLVEMAREMLGRLGYEVIVTTDSTEALSIFSAWPDRFHCVITDYTMPKATGVSLAKELISIRPNIPIILCTGYTEMISREEARALGIREFVMKPLVKRETAEVIRRVLDTKAHS